MKISIIATNLQVQLELQVGEQDDAQRLDVCGSAVKPKVHELSGGDVDGVEPVDLGQEFVFAAEGGAHDAGEDEDAGAAANGAGRGLAREVAEFGIPGLAEVVLEDAAVLAGEQGALDVIAGEAEGAGRDGGGSGALGSGRGAFSRAFGHGGSGFLS